MTDGLTTSKQGEAGAEKPASRLTVDLPWPPKELMPNKARGMHWGRKGEIAAKYRGDCWTLTKASLFKNPVRAIPAGNIPLMITFTPPDQRHRDGDNLIAAIKAAIDGFAEALCVNDRRFNPVSYYIAETPVKGGIVRVEIEQMGVGA